MPLIKGGLHETIIVSYTEGHYRKVSTFLTEENKSFHTYQLKSGKSLLVALKGIDSSVESRNVKEALQKLGYNIKNVNNIINKNKQPQPMSRVQIERDTKKLRKSENQAIYSMKYLLHRRITVEEPHKRNGLIQCMNSQESGHTKSYCKLGSVSFACGDLH